MYVYDIISCPSSSGAKVSARAVSCAEPAEPAAAAAVRHPCGRALGPASTACPTGPHPTRYMPVLFWMSLYILGLLVVVGTMKPRSGVSSDNVDPVSGILNGGYFFLGHESSLPPARDGASPGVKLPGVDPPISEPPQRQMKAQRRRVPLPSKVTCVALMHF